MIFSATKASVLNRGTPSDEFLTELVTWGRAASEDIFLPNANPADIYASIRPTLGPWVSILHRRAAMLEVMRVLAGFESSWKWNEGVDTTNSTSNRPCTMEAGAWQVSGNSMAFGEELTNLVMREAGTMDCTRFQIEMKRNHPFAMEYIARLLRRTCKHNGPVLRHEIDPYLRRSAVSEFEQLLA